MVEAEPLGDPVATADPGAEAVRLRLQSGIGTVAGASLQSPAAVQRFYEERLYQPAWLPRGQPSAQIDALLRTVASIHEDGLQPEDYHLETVKSLLAKPEAERPVGELELLLTDGFLSLASHLRSGRLNPASVDPEWALPRRASDPLVELTIALRDNDVEGQLRRLVPATPAYRQLRTALARYREIVAAGGWGEVPDGRRKLEPGKRDPRVPALRARLAAETGELAADDPELYDPALAARVKAFQKRHGLTDDGVIGRDTLAALNVSAEDRLQQIQVNLERWRWLPHELGERHIRVNIADFSLEVVDNAQVVMRKRVIVGKEMQRTPVFTGRMTYLVLNPAWEVPPDIATKEILPQLWKDPGYLQKQNMAVLEGWGRDPRELDPAAVDWKQFKRFPYRLRQRPGATNALGQVKFMFPNPYSIYMHDTPSRNLFAKDKRAFSHGCIRVEKPLELAEWLLADGRESATKVDQVIASGEERTVALSRPLPVYILYWTAWVDADGVVQFREDLYGRDQRVDFALRAAPAAQARSI